MERTIELKLRRSWSGGYRNDGGFLGICSTFVDELLDNEPQTIRVQIRSTPQGKYRVGYRIYRRCVRVAGEDYYAFDLINFALKSIGISPRNGKFWFRITAL